MKDYMTAQEASNKWNISIRRVQVLCSQGRIPGAIKYASVWAIPKTSEKPADRRIVTGKYKNLKKK